MKLTGKQLALITSLITLLTAFITYEGDTTQQLGPPPPPILNSNNNQYMPSNNMVQIHDKKR